jgi:hypothetical protein
MPVAMPARLMISSTRKIAATFGTIITQSAAGVESTISVVSQFEF